MIVPGDCTHLYVSLLLFACWVILRAFLSSAVFFFKITFIRLKSFSIVKQLGFRPDWTNVCKCYHPEISADDTCRQRVNWQINHTVISPHYLKSISQV